MAVTVLFAWYWYKSEVAADKTVPVIRIEGDTLEVSLHTTTQELLAGVTAYDQKDGDISDRVIVESISKFSEIGSCKVFYAVCDSDNHVASASRKIIYKGYTSPRFFMNRSLCFSQMETINVASVLGAVDVLDGDISNNIIITSSDYEYGSLGTYTVKAEVTNSKGDLISLKLPLIVEERHINAPEITLSDYLIYAQRGQGINYLNYFVSATDSYEKDVSDTLYVENDYVMGEPGVYSFHYYVTDSLGRRGHSVLTVVVE